MAMARELGLILWGEVGHKWEEGDVSRSGSSLNVNATIAETKRLLALGCEKVFLEARVIREVIGAYGEKVKGAEQIRQVLGAVGQENMIIEITGQLPFDTRMAYRSWAVRTFGPEVNMGGGEPVQDLRYIEGIRRGVTFAKGPSKSSPVLWVKSLAKNGGKAAVEWWKEDYPIDPSVVQDRSAE
jgi:phosphosulfolactate synthase (CoM biosynthesis protein A)